METKLPPLKSKELKAYVIKMTPAIAKIFLRHNPKNRFVRDGRVALYASEMLAGEWAENGQPYIFDTDGKLKNGQHRSEACIRANYSYEAVLVTGIKPSAEHTLDTGLSRTLSDFLSSHEIPNAAPISSIIRHLVAWERGDVNGGKLTGRLAVTIGDGANAYFKNAEMFQKLFLTAQTLWRSNKEETILGKGAIAKYLYILQGVDFNDTGVEFLKHIIGTSVVEGTATQKLYSALKHAKKQKSTLSERWIIGMLIKSWDLYLAGNPQVQRIQYNVNAPLPILTEKTTPIKLGSVRKGIIQVAKEIKETKDK